MFEDFTLVNDQTLNIIDNFNDYIEKQINKPLPFSLKKTELIAETSSGEKTTKYLLQMFPQKILESKKSTFSSWKKSINCPMNPKEKKKLSSNITSVEIDLMYEKAKNAGALGGKISGAGAGGFLLLYCPLEKQNAVRQVLTDNRELPFSLSRDGSKTIFNIRN